MALPLQIHRRTARRDARLRFAPWLCLAALALLAANQAADDPQGEREPARPPGAGPANVPTAFLVPVPLPLRDVEDTGVKRTVDRLLAEFPREGPRPLLIFEFRPSGRRAVAGEALPAGELPVAGKGSQFERAMSSARYLASPRLSRVRTVAYLPNSVEGHAVLAVLACEEIIMHPDAEIGSAGIDEGFIDPTMRRAYSEIADRRRTIPEPLALGLLDKDLAVSKVTTLDGVRYVLEDELEAIQKDAAVRSVETLIPAGDMGRFSGRAMRLQHGFASHLAGDRRELANALELPPGGIQEDPSLGLPWQAVRLDVRGRVTARTVNDVLRTLRRLDSATTNFICVWIDSPGGSPLDSLRLAGELAELDASRIRSVAYVAKEARADAALIALACDHVVIAKDAILGGPGDHYMRGREVRDMRAPIERLAALKGRDWSLPMAMVDFRLEVHRYTSETTGTTRYFCAEELAQQADPSPWRRGDPIEVQQGVRGAEAVDLQLARAAVGDFGELLRMYDLGDDLVALRSDGFVSALERLAGEPWFARTLLFIGFFALISELSVSGLSAAGFVSGLCFMLFFWSQFLSGSAGWLEVLLFAGGAVCVALEILVIPGMGVFGVGGALMMIASIVLASQTFVIPRNPYQYEQLPTSLFMVVFAMGGGLAALAVMRRFLPDAPIFRRLMLAPPVDEEREDREQRESLVAWNYLLGKRGVTTTQLTPSGKARFGDDIVDVIGAGELIPRGSDIYVEEVQGNRVLVRSLDDETAVS